MVNVPTVSFNSGSVPVPPERPTRFATGTGMCFGTEGGLTPRVYEWLDFPMRIPVAAGFRSAPMGPHYGVQFRRLIRVLNQFWRESHFGAEPHVTDPVGCLPDHDQRLAH